MIKKSKFLWLIFCSVFIFSCRKDKPETFNNTAVVNNSGSVYIINEGNFQFGNAKVSYYDFASGNVAEDLFQPANHAALGDVCQSINSFNNKIYLVLNNSQKIVVVNPSNFVQTTTINGFNSPRYFLPVSNNKAYVTDLYANAISIVDLNSNSITGNIPLKGWTEELLQVYGEVFVCNKNSDKLFVINAASDKISDSILISYGANSIQEDKNGKLWVLCNGDSTKNIHASLRRINPISHQVEKNFSFADKHDFPQRLKINESNDILFFINGGIFKMNIADNNLPSNSLVPKGTHNFYGIGVNPVNGDLYAADAIDYVQRGMIYRYKNDGTLISNFLAGIIPSDFYFN
jgi:hypothetical protein